MLVFCGIESITASQDLCYSLHAPAQPIQLLFHRMFNCQEDHKVLHCIFITIYIGVIHPSVVANLKNHDLSFQGETRPAARGRIPKRQDADSFSSRTISCLNEENVFSRLPQSKTATNRAVVAAHLSRGNRSSPRFGNGKGFESSLQSMTQRL